MSIIDLIKDNAVAAGLATAIAGGAIIYVVVPGSGNRFPDRFEVSRSDGMPSFICDLTATENASCTDQRGSIISLRFIQIKRHPGDPSQVMVNGYNAEQTGVTWKELSSDGIIFPERPFGGNKPIPAVTIKAHPTK